MSVKSLEFPLIKLTIKALPIFVLIGTYLIFNKTIEKKSGSKEYISFQFEFIESVWVDKRSSFLLKDKQYYYNFKIIFDLRT